MNSAFGVDACSFDSVLIVVVVIVPIEVVGDAGMRGDVTTMDDAGDTGVVGSLTSNALTNACLSGVTPNVAIN